MFSSAMMSSILMLAFTTMVVEGKELERFSRKGKVVTEEVDLEDRITIHADQPESDKPNSSVERIDGDIFVFTSFLTTNIV